MTTCTPYGFISARSPSEALNAHFQHKNYREMGAHLGKHGIVSAEFKKYRVDYTEPVYDPTGKPRGDFFTRTA